LVFNSHNITTFPFSGYVCYEDFTIFTSIKAQQVNCQNSKIMEKNSPILSLVKTDSATVEADADIQVVRQIFNQSNHRILPVVRDRKFVGVILREDFLRKFVASDDYLLCAKDLISKEMAFLSPTNTLAEAKEVFDTDIFNVLPVANDDGKLVGILFREEVEQQFLALPIPLT
jgi:CBS domain-containing protein